MSKNDRKELIKEWKRTNRSQTWNDFKRQEIKLTSSEIQLIMLLRENYLTVNEFVESASIGSEIQAESSNNLYYDAYYKKVQNIHYDINNRSPL